MSLLYLNNDNNNCLVNPSTQTMQNIQRHRHQRYRLSSVILFFLLFANSLNAQSAGWGSGFGQKRESGKENMWPVIRNNAQDELGLYGGISSAYALNGKLESVVLLILPTGYVVPLLDGGLVATYPVAYFESNNCQGNEYLPASLSGSVLLPFGGLVYRSLATSKIRFIPKYQAKKIVKVRSKLGFDRDSAVVCERVDVQLQLFSTVKNSIESSGFAERDDIGPIAIEMNAQRAPVKAGRLPPPAESASIIQDDNKVYPPLQECSPRCLVEAVGNKSCDIECYNEACSFDGGDCASKPEAELQKELSKICSPGCFAGDIGDGFCDAACNTDSCKHDGGDCDKPQ